MHRNVWIMAIVALLLIGCGAKNDTNKNIDNTKNIENTKEIEKPKLNVNEQQLLTGKNSKLHFTLELTSSPTKVELFRNFENNEELIGELKDETYGNIEMEINDIGGDNIYTTLIEETPEVRGDYKYYAKVIYSNKIITSTDVKITVHDSFSYEEFEDMEYVNNYLENVQSSEEFKEYSEEEKANVILKALDELSEQGKVKKDSYSYDYGETIIGFEYSCGALGGVQIVEFDPMMN